MQRNDSAHYQKRKQFFGSLLTIFGRLSVLEALQMDNVQAYKLHLATSNKSADILDQIQSLAQTKGVEIAFHDRAALSRISKNGKQDQGVALDIKPSSFSEFDAKLTFSNDGGAGEYIALDRITNPQNLGMIIRSVCASPIKALILPRSGCAKLDPLVIKASAGTLFRTPIIRCDSLISVLNCAKQKQLQVIGLDLNASMQLSDLRQESGDRIFVLGNESEGISDEIRQQCSSCIKIPMRNSVESLNVAVTASLIALRHQL